jgi:hypothetical protein
LGKLKLVLTPEKGDPSLGGTKSGISKWAATFGMLVDVDSRGSVGRRGVASSSGLANVKLEELGRAIEGAASMFEPRAGIWSKRPGRILGRFRGSLDCVLRLFTVPVRLMRTGDWSVRRGPTVCLRGAGLLSPRAAASEVDELGP